MPNVFIGVGSNIDPKPNIRKALELLAAQMTLTAVSTFYWTRALGCVDQQPFLNGVVSGFSDRTPQALKTEVLCFIEMLCGRTRTEDRYAARTIDLDVLLYGNEVLYEPNLVIPHLDIRQRLFVSVPLLELAPDLVLPDTGERLTDLLDGKDPNGFIPAHDFTQELRERLRL